MKVLNFFFVLSFGKPKNKRSRMTNLHLNLGVAVKYGFTTTLKPFFTA